MAGIRQSATPEHFVTLLDEATSPLMPQVVETGARKHWVVHVSGFGAGEDYSGLRFLKEWVQATAAVNWRSEQLINHIACRDYGSLVEGIPEVESVVCTVDGPVTHVWTYLDRDPFDEATRYRVYELEQEVLRVHPRAQLDFHLVNLAEYPAELRASLRATGSLVYTRAA